MKNIKFFSKWFLKNLIVACAFLVTAIPATIIAIQLRNWYFGTSDPKNDYDTFLITYVIVITLVYQLIKLIVERLHGMIDSMYGQSES